VCHLTSDIYKLKSYVIFLVMYFIREVFHMIIFVVVKRVFQLWVFGALKGCVSVSFGFSGHFVVLVNVVASDSWF
jgi:hypothetical protein